MAYNFVAGDRDQLLLMPPSLAEWLPAGHLVWFVLDVVGELDLAAFVAAYRADGRGGAAYDPSMMVALLVYAYCVGERSSRAIERRCSEDVAFRVIAANQVPDHATVARFRATHQGALAGLFGQVLRLCANAGLIRAGLVAIDGTRMQANASQEAIRRRMVTLRSEIEELAGLHINAALTRTPVEFMDDIANAIPIRVVSKLIGFRDEDPDELLATAFGSTAMLAATESLDDINALMERSLAVFGWMNEQLVERASDSDADGILGAVHNAVASGDLDVGAGLTIIHTLLSAGGESTTSLLGNAAYILATMPDLQHRLRDEPELVGPFIEEVLRLESPFRYHLRHVFRTTELCGVTIPAGSTMLLFWGAANRDPAEYERPDEVVLDRPRPRHHLAFGRGIHLCVGAPLARLEAEVILTQFLRRTTDFTLAPTHPPDRLHSLMVRRFNSLPLLTSGNA